MRYPIGLVMFVCQIAALQPIFSLGVMIYREFFVDSSLTDMIRDINYTAWPKGGGKSVDIKKIESKIKEYKEFYLLALQNIGKEKKKYKREFNQLILAMLHPQSNMRPSLKRSIKKITKIISNITR